MLRPDHGPQTALLQVRPYARRVDIALGWPFTGSRHLEGPGQALPQGDDQILPHPLIGRLECVRGNYGRREFRLRGVRVLR